MTIRLGFKVPCMTYTSGDETQADVDDAGNGSEISFPIVIIFLFLSYHSVTSVCIFFFLSFRLVYNCRQVGTAYFHQTEIESLNASKCKFALLEDIYIFF